MKLFDRKRDKIYRLIRYVGKRRGAVLVAVIGKTLTEWNFTS